MASLGVDQTAFLEPHAAPLKACGIVVGGRYEHRTELVHDAWRQE